MAADVEVIRLQMQLDDAKNIIRGWEDRAAISKAQGCECGICDKLVYTRSKRLERDSGPWAITAALEEAVRSLKSEAPK